MFPWSPEFVWDTAHILFFGALYAVAAVVAGTLALVARRAIGKLSRAESVVWHADFDDMPAEARACRHQLTGEAPGRTCANGFDCRRCTAHASFPVRGCASEGSFEALGLSLPLNRLYHRGHTWVRPEKDGTLTFGLDAIGRRLVGTPDLVDLPAAGTSLTVNGTGCRMRVAGSDVRVLAPVDGEVVEARGEGADWQLRVKPAEVADLRHLLSGDEVRSWALREIERLEQALGLRGVGQALADGGELVADLPHVLPRRQMDALLGEMFLEP